MPANLRTFTDELESNLFLICTLAFIQRPDPRVHFLIRIQLIKNLSHPLRSSVTAWDVNIFEDKLLFAVAFDHSWLIPEELDLLTINVIYQFSITKNNGNLPLPFFGGNYPIVLLDKID